MKRNTAVILVLLFSLTSCYKYAETVAPALNVDFDAAYVVNGESSSISVIDLKSNEVKGTITLGSASGGHSGEMNTNISWPHHIYLNPAKNQLVLGVPGYDLSQNHTKAMEGMKGKSVILQAKTGQVIEVIDHPVSNHNAAFSPDGTEIWTAQMEEKGKVLIFDENSYALKHTIEVGNDPSEVTFSHDGSIAFVANSSSYTVTAIRVSDKTILKTIPVGHEPVGAWAAADNKMYVDNEHLKSISIIDVATLTVEETIFLDFTPGMVALNSPKNELWITDADNGGAVYFYRLNNEWVKAGKVETGKGTHGIVFTKDEKTAYITNQFSESVSVIEVESKKKIKDIKVGKKPNGIVLRES